MTLPRVQLTPEIGRNKPTCDAKVKVSKERTITRAQREREARLADRPADVCGRRATHLVDGNPRCFAHAGQDALKALLENSSR